MYKLIYSVATEPCGGRFVLLGFIPAAVGVIMLWARRHSPMLRLKGKWYPVVMVVGGGVWLLAGTLFLLRCFSLRDALSSGRTDVREGVVERYTETTKDAVFTVAGKTFTVSPYRIGPGYKLLRRDGSPLRDGLSVRVHYYDGELLELEVAQ